MTSNVFVYKGLKNKNKTSLSGHGAIWRGLDVVLLMFREHHGSRHLQWHKGLNVA
jgi:hypothetical protein